MVEKFGCWAYSLGPTAIVGEVLSQSSTSYHCVIVESSSVEVCHWLFGVSYHISLLRVEFVASRNRICISYPRPYKSHTTQTLELVYCNKDAWHPCKPAYQPFDSSCDPGYTSLAAPPSQRFSRFLSPLCNMSQFFLPKLDLHHSFLKDSNQCLLISMASRRRSTAEKDQ